MLFIVKKQADSIVCCVSIHSHMKPPTTDKKAHFCFQYILTVGLTEADLQMDKPIFC